MVYKPYINFGVGDHVKDELEYRGWTQNDLAEILEKSSKTISELVNNKISINYEWAMLLSSVFKQSPQFWMNLYIDFKNNCVNESKDEENAQRKALIFEKLPIKEMQKKKWFPKFDSIEELITQVKRFVGSEELNFDSFDKEFASVKLRRSNLDNYLQRNAITWFAMAKHASNLFPLKSKYEKKKLSLLADNLINYTFETDGVEKFITELNYVGVNFFVLEHLQNTYLDGASFLNGRPVITYTKRHDRLDNFWFTVAHEIGHILLHLNDDNKVFIDVIESKEENNVNDEFEIEADKFANKILHVEQILQHFKPQRKYIQRKAVIEFSQKSKIHKSIIVGVLQHYKYLHVRNLNDFKSKVSDLIPREYFIENRIDEIHKKILKTK